MPFQMRKSDKRGLLWGAMLCGLGIVVAVWVLVHIINVLSDKPPADSHLHIQNADGVQCVVYKAPKRGGVSCNWEKHNNE